MCNNLIGTNELSCQKLENVLEEQIAMLAITWKQKQGQSVATFLMLEPAVGCMILHSSYKFPYSDLYC